MGKKRVREREPVLFYIAKISEEIKMKCFVWIVLILVLISSIAGCARARRIANDLDWIVLDGEPSKEN